MNATFEMLLRDLKLLILVALTLLNQMANVAIATQAPLSYDEKDKYGVAQVSGEYCFRSEAQTARRNRLTELSNYLYTRFQKVPHMAVFRLWPLHCDYSSISASTTFCTVLFVTFQCSSPNCGRLSGKVLRQKCFKKSRDSSSNPYSPAFLLL